MYIANGTRIIARSGSGSARICRSHVIRLTDAAKCSALAARDLVRLANRYWRNRPDLEESFLSRYGNLTDLDHQVIEHSSHLDTLTAAVRATGRRLPT